LADNPFYTKRLSLLPDDKLPEQNKETKNLSWGSDAASVALIAAKACPGDPSKDGCNTIWRAAKTPTTEVVAPHVSAPWPAGCSWKYQDGLASDRRHHFIAQKHAVGGEHIGQAVIRH
jgi:hypothetical protein